jgi:hypothetical protein
MRVRDNHLLIKNVSAICGLWVLGVVGREGVLRRDWWGQGRGMRAQIAQLKGFKWSSFPKRAFRRSSLPFPRGLGLVQDAESFEK